MGEHKKKGPSYSKIKRRKRIYVPGNFSQPRHFNPDYEERVDQIEPVHEQRFERGKEESKEMSTFDPDTFANGPGKQWKESDIKIDPAELLKRLEKEPEYLRLKRILDTPEEKRTAELRRILTNRDLPPINAAMVKLQAQMDPLLDQLEALDRKMRLLIRRANLVRFRAYIIRPEGDKTIERKIAVISHRLESIMRHELFEKTILEMRRKTGYWGPLKAEARRRRQILKEGKTP